MQIWNGPDEYYWRYRAHMILSTDRQTDKVKPVCSPFNFVEAGGIKIQSAIHMSHSRNNLQLHMHQSFYVSHKTSNGWQRVKLFLSAYLICCRYNRFALRCLWYWDISYMFRRMVYLQKYPLHQVTHHDETTSWSTHQNDTHRLN